MDRSKAQKWVDENAERIKNEMGLGNWRLTVELDHIEDRNGKVIGAQVKPQPHYEKATVWINFDQIHTLERLEEDLRHELMHVLHSPFDLLYEAILEMLNPEQLKIANALWNHAEEMTVRNLERFYECATRGDENADPT